MRTASFSVVTIIDKSRRMQRLMKLRISASAPAIDEAANLSFGEIVVIDKPQREVYVRSEVLERALEALRDRDRANRTNERAAQRIEHEPFRRVNVLQIERTMRALDDLSRAIVTADALDEFFIRFAGVLGDKNITGAPQILRWFVQP